MSEYVICPYSKPEYLEKLISNLRRQTRQGFRTVVVENGPAVGTFPSIDGVTVLRSEAHQSAAKNAALEHVRRDGGGRWSCFDCDDYYGPQYLESQMAALDSGALLAGKSFGSLMYVRFDDGMFLDGAKGMPIEYKFLNGGATSCSTSDVPNFPMVAVGEDGEWHKLVRQRKERCVNTGPRHYCYNRMGGGHTWSVSEEVESSLKKRMLLLGDLPESTCEVSPKSLVQETGQTVSRVVMLHTPDYLPASVAVPDMEDYCRIWGYELEHHGDLIRPDWPASWNKIPALLGAMSRAAEGEWVLWMDCDMVMTKVELPLEVMAREGKDVMFSVDGNGICLGYFLIRNVQAMRDFLEELVADWRPDWPWDQDSAKDLIARRPDVAERVGHIPEDVVQNPVSRPSRLSMVMHYWANSRLPRQVIVEKMKRDIYSRDMMAPRGGRPWLRRL